MAQARKKKPATLTRSIQPNEDFRRKIGKVFSFKGSEFSVIKNINYTELPSVEGTPRIIRTMDGVDFPEPCVLKDVHVKLESFDVTNNTLGIVSWHVFVHFEVIPPGSIAQANFPNLQPNSPPLPAPIYDGPGTMCGSACEQSKMLFEVMAHGTDSNGVVRSVATSAPLLYTASTTTSVPVSMSISVPPPPPGQGNRPRPLRADLWFLFSVASMC